MDSNDDFTTSPDTSGAIVDFDDIATLSSAIGVQNNSNTDEFIMPSSTFGIHWTGFLHSKQVKSAKTRRYNAKCLYCNKIFEAQKEAIISHVINTCQKILAEEKILYIQKIKKNSKDRRVTLTEFFDKATIPSKKLDELHTLLLQSLIYSNIPFRFVENPFFALFLKKLHSTIEISKKDKNNQTDNNNNIDSTELEEYDELFSTLDINDSLNINDSLDINNSLNINDSIELETNALEEIDMIIEQGSSNLFLEQLINFDIEELTVELNEKNTNRTEVTNEWTLDKIL
ncbi:1847_t:CDS:2, partial [Gigaspora margarita]